VLINQPSLADELVSSGYGLGKVDVFTRRFVLCGPVGGFEDADSVLEAFAWIGESDLGFLSYAGDALQVEVSIWGKLQINPQELLKRVAAKGAGADALAAIAEKDAYALVDFGAWQKWSGTGALLACGKGDELLCKCQAVWLNPAKAPGKFLDEGRMFAEWLKGDEALRLIEESEAYEIY
jgi:ABC-type tungstate transport system permease subunit